MLTTSAKVANLWGTVRRAWTPPPRISLPKWADRYRVLAREAGSTAGRWNTATVEIARGPMTATCEPCVHIITVMVATQLLKTELLLNVIGFHAHLDPCPILLLQPKDESARQFSKERLTPMIRNSPVLRELIGTRKMRDGDETISEKYFSGGFVAIAGAGSPDNLARRPVRVILCDEVDRYIATREGDAITLAQERCATFDTNWLCIRACSPTVAEESRIEQSWNESDQRRASVACPHCGHRQFLDFFRHIEWDKQRDEKGTVVQHHPETARVYCELCGAGWSEGERLAALQTARWHQTRPFQCCGVRHDPLEDYNKAWHDGACDPVEQVWTWWQDTESQRYAVYRAKCSTCGAWPVDNRHAGFQASKLYSPWQTDRPADIAAKWLAAQGDESKTQTFWNTQMGLPYRPHTGRRIQAEVLAARAEVWAAEVPDGTALLTTGIDVQDYRCECETVGWGRNEESWSIDYTVIDGEFSDATTQAHVDAYLKRIWTRADGRPFEVMATCIDSGGHHTQSVYTFSKQRIGRRVWAIKGESARGGERNPVWPSKRPTSRTKRTFRPIILGVNAAKDTIRQRLLLDVVGPGYMHFPADRDLNYYLQISSERLVTKELGGKRFRVWELPPGRANEALDCRVYAYAGLCALLHFGLQLNRRADAIGAWTTPTPPKTPRPATARSVAGPAASAAKRTFIQRLA